MVTFATEIKATFSVLWDVSWIILGHQLGHFVSSWERLVLKIAFRGRRHFFAIRARATKGIEEVARSAFHNAQKPLDAIVKKHHANMSVCNHMFSMTNTFDPSLGSIIWIAGKAIKRYEVCVSTRVRGRALLSSGNRLLCTIPLLSC